MPIRLSFVCHARTQAQRLGRFALDEPAEAKSLEKATQMAAVLKKPVRILCAPEIRALQTAHALGGEIEIVPALEDYDFGDWKGQSLTDLQESIPHVLADWLSNPNAAPHNGESVQDLCLRVGNWLDTFGEDGHFAVVTHPFVIRAALLHALAASTASFNLIDIEPLAIVDLRFNGRWRLRF
ncbi:MULTISPECIES: histidine phosphatase family protein [unclassified Pseudomonas]|uniref:histidine phosphatase family protein n=1 Tax=unclassified Pseudomonas TaxID=196821 RepID=UPI000758DE54|nr:MULTISPECIES: phosphoglycerate mutase family protein [unclassified Pseudomonas]KVV05221.1 Alpha-ribazole phosphatase [Pseudomonas sp. TAD18]KVV06890.1 Alpha-ribazole phosphatase [Pseudomonas sp. TAA207]